MKQKSRFIASTLAMFRQLSVAALAAIVLIAMPVASNAQDTTSSIRGNVTAPDGGPAAGVSVEPVVLQAQPHPVLGDSR
jgi:hypothetical protein